MPSDLDKDLEDFFEKSKQRKKVVADAKRFKEKVGQIGVPYQKLESAKAISKLTSSLLSGLGISGITAVGWFGSLSVLAQFGVAAGLVATPWGWIILAGLAGAGLSWTMNMAFKKMNKAAYSKIPNFINSPLDLLGDQIYKTISAAFLCVLGKDRYASESTLNAVVDYFIDQWGLDREYITTLHPEIMNDKDSASIQKVSMRLKQLDKNKDINLRLLIKEITSGIDGLIRSSHALDIGAAQRLNQFKLDVGASA